MSCRPARKIGSTLAFLKLAHVRVCASYWVRIFIDIWLSLKARSTELSPFARSNFRVVFFSAAFMSGVCPVSENRKLHLYFCIPHSPMLSSFPLVFRTAAQQIRDGRTDKRVELSESFCTLEKVFQNASSGSLRLLSLLC